MTGLFLLEEVQKVKHLGLLRLVSHLGLGQADLADLVGIQQVAELTFGLAQCFLAAGQVFFSFGLVCLQFSQFLDLAFRQTQMVIPFLLQLGQLIGLFSLCLHEADIAFP